MLLSKIILNDFGIYRGSNQFNFRTTSEKPILLCGGMNGAGKTTLFESIMLCLYGQDSFELKISKKQYLDRIARAFHRDLTKKKSADTASITVEFEFAHDGKITVYHVERIWRNLDGSIAEELVIKKKKQADDDFTNLDSMEKSEWQQFINQLIPKGIARLFFFDGEKIQRIAEEGTEDQYIRASFDALLGLDIVNQLNSDLSFALERINEEVHPSEIECKIKSAEKEKIEIEKRIDSNIEKQISIKTEMVNLQKKIQVKEDLFSKLGGKFYEKHEELISSKFMYQAGLQEIENNIRSLCADVLPFALIPKQLQELKDEIKSDQQKVQSTFEKKILEKTFKEIQKQINSEGFLAKIKDDAKKEMQKQLEGVFEDKLNSLNSNQPTTLSLSPKDMEKMISLIDEISKAGPSRIQSLAESYNKTVDGLNSVKTALDNIPKDNEIGPLLSEINQYNKELGMLEAQLSELKIQENIERHYMNKENKEIRSNLEKKFTDKRVLDGLELGPKIQTVLKEYSESLREKKLALLENYILDGLEMLLHKKEFVHKVKINQDTFEVKLYNKNEDEITKEMLSKGELQMFATAVVWGLAKTSGRPLPFVIDTPLARLDDEHRDNLIENFYPYASHQIVIFSTNSEITQKLYKKLEPSITRSFIIRFDSKQGTTINEQGYFFDENGGKIIEIQQA